MKYSQKLCLVVLSLAMILAGFTSVEAAPRMVIPKPVLDLGIVAPGLTPEMIFTIENQGDEPLTINARPTCGCTVASWDRTIAPGTSGQVRAVIDTAKFRGKVSKVIMVLANDPQTPSMQLVAKVEVRPVIEVLPRPLVRLDSQLGEAASTTVVLRPTVASEPELEIIAIEPGVEYVTATARRLAVGENEVPGRYEITLGLNEDAPIGLVNVPVTIRTNHAEAPIVGIRVVGRVKSAS